MVQQLQPKTFLFWGICSLSLLVMGCGDSSTSPTVEKQDDQQSNVDAVDSQSQQQAASPPKRKFAPVKLGSSKQSSAGHSHSHADASPQATTVLKAVQPLQVMLGTWQGKTFRSRVVDNAEWIWDFKSDKDQPALVMSTDNKNPLLSAARLTFLSKEQKYQLSITDNQGNKRVLQGKFIVPVADVPGDDKKLQRTYKLEFTQTAPAESDEMWQIVFNQQENNRYLVEFSRKRGQADFHKFETIASQRKGTSFASIDPDDYGEKTCIITEGLGTMTVSFEGKSYWVCCSGCKAAFEDDPKTWIAKLEERKKMKK